MMLETIAIVIRRHTLMLNLLRGLIVFAGFLVFFFGAAHFRDAPIHPCRKDGGYFYLDHPLGYCGKQGQSHTAADFRRFQEWEDVMFVLWPLVMLSMASLVWQAKRQKL